MKISLSIWWSLSDCQILLETTGTLFFDESIHLAKGISTLKDMQNAAELAKLIHSTQLDLTSVL